MTVSPRAATRLGWGAADQGLTSLVNFALAAVIARTIGPEDFGAFTIAFTAYLVVLGISRSIATQPLLIRYSTVSLTEWRRGTGLAAGVVLVIGAVGGALCAIGALGAEDERSQEALLVFAVMLPGLLFWDIWRYAFFAAGRGRSAFVLDLVLAAMFFTALGAIAILGVTSVVSATIAWGASAMIVALGASVYTGVVPQPLGAMVWWREHRDIGLRYTGEVTADMTAGLLSYNGVAILSGLAAVGALRGAQLLLGPVNIVLLGIPFVAIAEGVRLLRRSPEALSAGCAALSVSLVSATAIWGAITLAAPDAIGRLVLGPSWDPARAVLLPSMIAVAGFSASVGPGVGLRAFEAARESFRVRLVQSAATLVAVVGGAAIGGVVGAAWGSALAAWIGAALYWLQFQLTLNAWSRSMDRRPVSELR